MLGKLSGGLREFACNCDGQYWNNVKNGGDRTTTKYGRSHIMIMECAIVELSFTLIRSFNCYYECFLFLPFSID